MVVSKEEAQAALAEIDAVKGRMSQISAYRSASPYLITWGVVWIVGHLTAEFEPQFMNQVWGFFSVSAFIVCLGISFLQARRNPSPSRYRRRWVLIFITLAIFIACLFALIGPIETREGNALISVFWACLYMGIGAWVGWRIFLIGAATVAAVMFAYLALDQYYFLWMGVVGGGSLFAGGLWLRTV